MPGMAVLDFASWTLRVLSRISGKMQQGAGLPFVLAG